MTRRRAGLSVATLARAVKVGEPAWTGPAPLLRPENNKERELPAMSQDKRQNLQDTFLNSVRKTKTPLTIFLVNGVKLQGVVTGVVDDASDPHRGRRQG